MPVFDYGEAVLLLERPLGVQEVLDSDDKIRRCDLLLAVGAALLPSAEARRAYEEVAEEVFALAETHGDQQRASRACQVPLEGLNRYGAEPRRQSASRVRRSACYTAE